MRTKGWSVVPTALLLICAFATPASAAQQRKIEPLNQYVVSGGDQSKLAAMGYDLAEGGSAKGRVIVGTPADAAQLRAKGYTVTAPYGEARAAVAAPPN